MVETAAPSSAPPVTGTGRAAVSAVATTVACVLPVFLVGGLAVQVSDELRFSPAGLGLVVSVYFGVSALAAVPSGRLVERYGPAATARVAICVAAAVLLAVAGAARSLTLLVAILAAGATANALGQIASNAALAARVPPHRQGLSFGIKQSAIPLSTLLAGASVPALALTLGWRWAFVAAAGLALTALPLVPADGPAGGPRPRHGTAGSVRASGRPAGAHLNRLVLVGAAAMLAAGSANALGTFLVDSSVSRGIGPGLAGWMLSVGGAVCVVSRVLGGWLADRRSGGHIAVLAGMLAVGALGLALLALPGTGPLVAGVLLGFGLGWAWPGLMNFAVVRLHPAAPAAATSITQTGVFAGGCVGPLALGPVAAHLGYPRAWLSAAVAMLLAAALMLLARRLLRQGR